MRWKLVSHSFDSREVSLSLLWQVERTLKCTLELNTCLIMYDNKASHELVAFPRLSINGNEINTESKKTNCHKWLIRSRQPSNLYQRLLSQKAADVTAEFLHQKGCNLFADHTFDCGVMSDFKMNAFTSKESFCMLPVLFCDIPLLCQGEDGPTSCMQDKRQSPCYWCLRRERRWNRAD